MTEAIRAGLIGAGVFGRWHARKYAAHPGCVLVGVFDINPDVSEKLAGELGATAFQSIDDLCAAVDIVSIASPATTHASAAERALKSGCSVLVEKPLAASVNDARHLIDLASRTGQTLALGHQEWLVLEAMGVFDLDERPTLIESVRSAPTSARGQDVPVAIDLMIHDANLVLSLMDTTRPSIIAANAGSCGDPSQSVTADIGFPGGGRAQLSASRAADSVQREMRLHYPSGDIRVDFLTRQYLNNSSHRLRPQSGSSIAITDPLQENINRFVAAVSASTTSQIVDGEAGLAALWLVDRIDAVARSGIAWRAQLSSGGVKTGLTWDVSR